MDTTNRLSSRAAGAGAAERCVIELRARYRRAINTSALVGAKADRQGSREVNVISTTISLKSCRCLQAHISTESDTGEQQRKQHHPRQHRGRRHETMDRATIPLAPTPTKTITTSTSTTTVCPSLSPASNVWSHHPDPPPGAGA